MLASPKELGIGEAHEGILEITKDVPAGTRFADAYELNDYLLDIENKSLTHRPDTFGLIGFAREVAAIQGNTFETPARIRAEEPEWIEKDGNEPTPNVTIDDPELSARYQAVVLTGVDAKVQSPLETQTYLARIGVRPHSAVVDATNYLMMLTGQPLHAFDYDKLKAVNNGEIDIHVRTGREGETLLLLDGRTIELSTNDIVIANGEKAVALAGAMGGAETEIDDNTTNVLLESATFNLYNLRNTQMRHGIFSEAITRFTKGQPAPLTAPVLAEAMVLLQASGGAVRASDVADAYPGRTDVAVVSVTLDRINQALGSELSLADVTRILQNVEFSIAIESDSVKIVVVAPYWRADIHIAEDLIEEIGRLSGFDMIEPTLPLRDFTAVSPDGFDTLRAQLRKTLARAGANEILTYSFVHGDLLQKAQQQPGDSYRITNSISPDLQYYRQTLTPSLLAHVHPNIKNGFDSFALFELNKTHDKSIGLDEDGVPKELDYLAFTVADKKSPNGAPYYAAKKQLDYITTSLRLECVYAPIQQDSGDALSAPFEYRRSAMVTDKVSGERIGIVGEYKKSVQKAFKLPEYTAGFELDLRALYQATTKSGHTYRPLSKYPSTERDICFRVSSETNYQSLIGLVEAVLSESTLETSVSPVDIYQGDDRSIKHVTIRILLTSHQKTLTGDETTAVIEKVIQRVVDETAAQVV